MKQINIPKTFGVGKPNGKKERLPEIIMHSSSSEAIMTSMLSVTRPASLSAIIVGNIIIISVIR